MRKSQYHSLTKREREVIVLAARGLSSKQIARLLGTSVEAVKAYSHRACLKLGMHDRNHAIMTALRRGIIQIDDIYSLDEIADMMAPLGLDAIEKIASLVRQRYEAKLVNSPVCINVMP
jgi:DNA-binding CsgD family transcriptional regulator